MFWWRSISLDLRTLVKHRENARVKSLIRSSDPSDLPDCSTTTTLLHLAAKYSNVDLVAFLLKSGYDIDARDSRGATPLLVAILHRNHEVVKYLLDANANVFVGNSLQLLLTDCSCKKSVVRHLKAACSRGINVDEASRLLSEADCSLELALRLENAELTRAMLQRTEEISIDRARDLLRLAMDSGYLDNVGVLLRHGGKAAYRREKFLQNLADRLRAGELQSVRPFLTRLEEEWRDVVDAGFVEFLQQLFERAARPTLELLLECRVDALVRAKFEEELLVHVFVNRNDSAIELIENVKVDARDKLGRTGLHLAALRNLPERVEFLLDRRANPNVKDKRGRTPLHLAWDVKCIELLLRAGADVQVVDYSGLTIFEKTTSLSDAMLVLLAYLAVIEARGVSVKRKISDKIEAKVEFREFYEKCRMQIEWMKAYEVCDSLTLFTALVKKPDDLICYVRDREAVVRAMGQVGDYGLHEFYVTTLKSNLSETLGMNGIGA